MSGTNFNASDVIHGKGFNEKNKTTYNVWCIKIRTKGSSKTLLSLVRILMHQTLHQLSNYIVLVNEKMKCLMVDGWHAICNSVRPKPGFGIERSNFGIGAKRISSKPRPFFHFTYLFWRHKFLKAWNWMQIFKKKSEKQEYLADNLV